jgi:DNA-binding response OmpR family regulator
MSQALILIVDDEAIERNTLSHILELEGYQVTAVGSGEEAISSLRLKPCDLMVVDLKMPGIGGMELLSMALSEFPNLRVVVLTAHGTLESVIEALRKRVDDYLLKPAQAEEIVQSIRNALNRSQSSEKSVSDEIEFYTTGFGGIPSKVYRLPNQVMIDTKKQIISWGTNTLILTPTEGRILNVLLENYDQVVTYTDIVNQIHGYRTGSAEAATVLRPIISRLREKLAPMPGGGELIRTVRGAGYLIVKQL